jgi:hypothetical protein
MTKMLTVLKNEIYVLVSRRSFWFGTLGVPLIAFLIYAGITWINRSQGGNGLPTSGIGAIFTREEDTRPQGYVDQSGVNHSVSDDFPDWHILASRILRTRATPDAEKQRLLPYPANT